MHRDARIARIAARQRGVVTFEQLLGAGLSRRAVEHRIACGRLHRLLRGVYLVGHEVAPPLARETAALLACGAGAVLSHHSAAALWRIVAATRSNVDVTVPRSGPSTRAGVNIHRVRGLNAADVRHRHRLTLTSPARTLLDLASVLTPGQLADAYERARATRLVRPADLHRAIDRTPRRRGCRNTAADHRRTAHD